MKVTCAVCKNECNAKVVDNGIGSYEYWGIRGFDSQKSIESDCCDAPCIDDEGIEISVSDYKKLQEAEREYN
jgi:hypothetical protein